MDKLDKILTLWVANPDVYFNIQGKKYQLNNVSIKDISYDFDFRSTLNERLDPYPKNLDEIKPILKNLNQITKEDVVEFISYTHSYQSTYQHSFSVIDENTLEITYKLVQLIGDDEERVLILTSNDQSIVFENVPSASQRPVEFPWNRAFFWLRKNGFNIDNL